MGEAVGDIAAVSPGDSRQVSADELNHDTIDRRAGSGGTSRGQRGLGEMKTRGDCSVSTYTAYCTLVSVPYYRYTERNPPSLQSTASGGHPSLTSTDLTNHHVKA